MVSVIIIEGHNDTKFYYQCGVLELIQQMAPLVLLRWQKFATRSVAVFCLTHHRGVGGGGACLQYALHWGAVQSSVPFPSPHASSHRTCQPPPPSLIIRTRRDAMVAAVDRATDQTEVLGSQRTDT